MIRILDNNALVYLYNNGLRPTEASKCLIPAAIKEEFAIESRREGWFRRCEFIERNLDDASYLSAYAQLLNEYPGVSFYNMKGFGDVAILATIRLLSQEQPAPTLSEEMFPPEPMYLATGDVKLREFAQATFGQRLILETPEELSLRL